MASVIYSPDIFSRQRVGGISRYFCELIRRARDRGFYPKLVAGVHFNQHLRALGTGCYIPRLGPLGRCRPEFNRWLSQIIATRDPTAIVHETYYPETDYSLSHPMIVTVHDMIDELLPGRPSGLRPGVKRRSCERADHIIAVSAATKKDLIELFGIPPEKITVIHHGSSLPAPKGSGA